MHILKKIMELTKPYWPRIAGGIVISLLLSGITAMIAWAVKPALDEIFVNGHYEYLKLLPAGIFLLFTTKGVLDYLQTYLMRSAGLKLMRETRNKLYNHILYLPISYFSRESSGVIISRVMHDVEVLKDLISNVIKNFVVALPTALFLLGVAFYRRWDLTVMTLVLMPFLAYSTRKFGKRIKKKRKEAQRMMSFLTQNVGETILGSRIVRIFTRESFMAKRFEGENRRYYREMLRVVRFKEFTALIADMVTGLGIAIILWYGGGMVQKGVMTPGDFASVIVAIYMLFPPIKKIGDAYTTLQETRASIERIDTLFDCAHEDPGRVRIDGFRDSLAYEKVSFAYSPGSPEVLREIDLVIRPGEVVAVVGHSGAGKSTLIDLLPKFYRPTQGRITIDGTDLNEADTYSLRALIGIVSQDIILFNDTIRENISFGREGAAEEEIVEAAKLAYVDDFVRDLPEAYDTVIGERGLKLSGGQRQRIAIARAILKNPPILILDEATSSLDSVSERLVQKALEDLMSGRTTIVIAHRLSTIRNADRIVILDKGKIVDIGTHEELMSRNETYIKLYNAFALA